MSEFTSATNRRILLVDDTEAIHRDFVSILCPAREHHRLQAAKLAFLGASAGQPSERIQFQIDSARQGEEAVELVQRSVDEARPYALVFTDMRMPPGWDGVETLQRIWRLDPRAQAVICSAHADYSWDELAAQLGASDQFLFLRKPFDNCEVRQLAIALTQKWSREEDSRRLVDELRASLVQRTAATDAVRDELTRVNRKLENARARAEQSSQAKNAFLANMSHEIRTPMTAILGYADFLLDEGDIRKAPPQRVLAINTIRRNGDHLLKLLNDIVDISKIEAEKLTINRVPCATLELVDEVLTSMKGRAAAKRLTLEREIVGEIPARIQTDPTRIRQVLVNLVGNAIKFTKVGGITVTMQMRNGEADASLLEFAVVDTGVGIEPVEIDRVFEAFTQADNATVLQHAGTGLGLSICRRLSGMLGGEVTVESTPAMGSTFRFTVDTGPLPGVPMIRQLPENDTSPDAAAGERPGRGIKVRGRILLAEDGPDNQRLFLHLLEKAGAEVTVAGDGQQACQAVVLARDQGQPFDCVLMDVQMPVMDGYDAVRRLRQEGFDLPIIALTAHAMKGARDGCLLAGFSDYLSKPIERRSFLELVARHTSTCG